ncbi:hypothetical protein ACWCQZ_50650 [Streptomyces sp. NPDC002285]
MTVKNKRMTGRVARWGGIGATTMAMMLGLAPSQAQAASSIYANLTMQVYSVPNSGQRTKATIDVHLPMEQADAAGYLYWGAYIKIACWGDDLFDDDWVLWYDLSGDPVEEYFAPYGDPYVPHDDRPYAAADGVRLRAVIDLPHGADPGSPDAYHERGVAGFNEDAAYTGDSRDEILCRATWVDADNAKMAAMTPVRSGLF